MAPYDFLRVTALPAKTFTVSALVLSVLTIISQPAQATGFDTLYSATSVCQEIRTFQTGVGDDEINTISIPEGPGPIVAAFVTWVGANDLTPDLVSTPGQADSSLTINGSEVSGVSPVGEAGSQELEPGKYWYAWNADIGPNGANILNGTSAHELSISGWKVTNEDEYHGRNGAEIDIVYDVSPCSEPVDVTILSGVDWIYETLGQPRSTTMVLPVAPAANERTETVRLSLWGGEKRTDRCRFSALWMLAGSDPLPTGSELNLFTPTPHQPAFGINNAVEIVANPFLGPDSTCEHEPNPEPDVPYDAGHLYPEGAATAPYNAVAVRRHALTSDAEVLSIEVELRVPGDASWVALQLESEGEHYGESGAWTASFTTSTTASAASSTSTSSEPKTFVDNVIVPGLAEVEQQAGASSISESEAQGNVETEVGGITVSNDAATNQDAASNQTVAGSIQASSSTSGSDASSSGTLALTGTSTFALVVASCAMIFGGLLLLRRRSMSLTSSET